SSSSADGGRWKIRHPSSDAAVRAATQLRTRLTHRIASVCHVRFAQTSSIGFNPNHSAENQARRQDRRVEYRSFQSRLGKERVGVTFSSSCLLCRESLIVIFEKLFQPFIGQR